MTKEEIQALLAETESTYLDWKQDFPPGLLGGKNDPNWDKDRARLLKSLVSLANSGGSAYAYLVYGVRDLGAERQICGISKSFDDADLQQ